MVRYNGIIINESKTKETVIYFECKFNQENESKLVNDSLMAHLRRGQFRANRWFCTVS
jgi:hypothetical protein